MFRSSGVPGFSTCHENQIIVPCKEPIKIEKPLQCLLTFSYSVGEKYSSDCLLTFVFSVFIFSLPSKVVIIVAEFMLLGINSFALSIKLI